jgi:hypothetical protein
MYYKTVIYKTVISKSKTNVQELNTIRKHVHMYVDTEQNYQLYNQTNRS